MLRQLVLILYLGFAISFPDGNIPNKNAEQPIITTPLGQIQGTIIASRLGKQIYSFRGIRYAKAPVNELRFQPPVAVEKWDGVLNATLDGPLCPQPTDQPISEDCLFVNVYSPKIPKGSEKPSQPVLVYIHGAGYKTNGGASNWVGPHYLLDQEIVLVTFNYRIGTLGFLSTGDKEAPGNVGLKDQVLLLKWVRDNIASFGGDPNCVTIMGYDFGAVAVTLHLVSPQSQTLFHKAIAMSGSSLGNWPVPHNQMDLAKKQAKLLGCPEDTSANIVKCLRGKTYSEISDTYPQFKEFFQEPFAPWLPVIEGEFGQERFLTGHPIQLVQNGQFAKVPFLTGVTTEEHACKAFCVLNNDTLRNELNNNFETIAPIALIYERGTDNSKIISKSLKSFYFSDKPIEKTSVAPTVQIFSDGITGFSVNRAAKLISEKNNQSVYYYKFNYAGRNSHFYTPQSNKTEPFGVVHNDDLMYLFYIEKLFPFFKDTTPNDAEMVQKMTTLWANFVKTGNPIPAPTEKLDNVKWEPFTTKTQKYMDIANKLVLNEKLNEKRYAEWEKLFPLAQYGKNKASG
ncbi:esterase E4 [Aethina tumida]|uniref:esterase E4 n=1 Tax=Aethina tumida TaxID=116153 RepID=UPI0021485CB7|nr:esterase E4 [Aethina tumida]